MLEASVNRQVQSGISMKARLILIQQDIESTCAAQPAFLLCEKSSHALFENSMPQFGMGFFVAPAPVWANVSKWDQVPASV